MRGPYERLKYDLRRLWECPVCKHRERTTGMVTFMHCLCRMQQVDGQPVVMKLIEDGVQRVGPRVVIRHKAVEMGSADESRVRGQEPEASTSPNESDAPSD